MKNVWVALLFSSPCFVYNETAEFWNFGMTVGKQIAFRGKYWVTFRCKGYIMSYGITWCINCWEFTSLSKVFLQRHFKILFFEGSLWGVSWNNGNFVSFTFKCILCLLDMVTVIWQCFSFILSAVGNYISGYKTWEYSPWFWWPRGADGLRSE